MHSRHKAWLVLAVITGLGLLALVLQGERGEAGESETQLSGVFSTVPYHAPPREMTLCGARVPLDDPQVRERFDREFTIVVYGHAQVYLWLKRAERYFPWIEDQLQKEGLPQDLKFLAVAESDLLHRAVSPAGAVGPWQFISGTGARYGLEQSRGVDQRYDFYKATGSAFSYLRDLYAMFDDWVLAMAAYNCGENRVRAELARQKAGDYYSLRLPLETERYIFRILAIKEVLTHPEKYGYSLPPGAGYTPLPQSETAVISLPHDMPLQVVAEVAGMNYRQFKGMNPSFISTVVPEGTHEVRLHRGRGKSFVETIDSIKEDFKPFKIEHLVASGETLSGIAARYGVRLRDVRSWNNLQGDRIVAGQTLVIHKIPHS